MSTQTERFFSRKSSGRYGHGIRSNQVNFMRHLPRRTAPAGSAARPFGLALLDEGASALHAILGGTEQRRKIVLQAEGVGERQPEPAHHGFLGVAEGDGC